MSDITTTGVSQVRAGQPVQGAQPSPAVQTPTANPACAANPSIPCWMIEQNPGNPELLADAGRIYSDDLAYYYLPSSEDQFGRMPVLARGPEEQRQYIFLDPREDRFAALQLLFNKTCLDGSVGRVLYRTNLTNALKTYFEGYITELKELRDNITEALGNENHYYNEERASRILRNKDKIAKLAGFLGIDLNGLNLEIFEGLKAALDRILDHQELTNFGQAAEERVVALASYALALQVKGDRAEVAEIQSLYIQVQALFRQIGSGEGASQLSIGMHDFGEPDSLIELNRQSITGLGEVYVTGPVHTGTLPTFIKYVAKTLGISDYTGFAQYLHNPTLIDRGFVVGALGQEASAIETASLPGFIDPGMQDYFDGETGGAGAGFLTGDVAYFNTGETDNRPLVLVLGEGDQTNYVYLWEGDSRLAALLSFYDQTGNGVINPDNLSARLKDYLEGLITGFTTEGQLRDLANRLGVNVLGSNARQIIEKIKEGLETAGYSTLLSAAAYYLSRAANTSEDQVKALLEAVKNGARVGRHTFAPQTVMRLERRNSQIIENLYYFAGEVGPSTGGAPGLMDINAYRTRGGAIPEAFRFPLYLSDSPQAEEDAYQFFTGAVQYRLVSDYAGPEVVGVMRDGQIISLSGDARFSALRLLYRGAFEDPTENPVLRGANLERGLRKYLSSLVDELSVMRDILTAQEDDPDKIREFKYEKIAVLQKLAQEFGLNSFDPEGSLDDFLTGLSDVIARLDRVGEGEVRRIAEEVLSTESGAGRSEIADLLGLISAGEIKIAQRQFERGRIYTLNRQTLQGIKIGGFEVQALAYSAQPLPEQLSDFLKIAGVSLFGSEAATYGGFCEAVNLRANDGSIDAAFYQTYSGRGAEDNVLRIYYHAHPAEGDRELISGSARTDFAIYAGERLLVSCRYNGNRREPEYDIRDDSDPRLTLLWEQLSRYSNGRELITYKEKFDALQAFYMENQEVLAGGLGEISEEAGVAEQTMAFNVYMRDFASLGNQAVELKLLNQALQLAQDLTFTERKMLFLVITLLATGKILKPGTDDQWINITSDGRPLESLSEANLQTIIRFIKQFHADGSVELEGQTLDWVEETFISVFRTVDQIGRTTPTVDDEWNKMALAQFINRVIIPQLRSGSAAASEDADLGQLQNLVGISLYGPFMNPALDDSHNFIILQALRSLINDTESRQRQDLRIQNEYAASFVPSIEIDSRFLTILVEETDERCRLGPISFDLALENSRLIRAARAMGSAADAYSILLAYAGKNDLSGPEIIAILNAPVVLVKLETGLAPRSTVTTPESLADLYFDIDRLTHQYSISEEQPAEEPAAAQPVAVPQTGTAGLYLAGVSSLTQEDLGKLANLWLYAFTLHPSAIPLQEWEAMAAFFGAGSVDQIPLILEGTSRRNFIDLLHRVPAFLTPSLIRGLGQLYRPRYYTYLTISELGAAALKKIRDNNWFGLTAAEKDLVELLLNQKINEAAGEEGLLSKIISEADQAGLKTLLAKMEGLLNGNPGNGESASALRHAVTALQLYLSPSNIAPIQQEILKETELQALENLADLIASGRLTINGQTVRGIAGFAVPQGLTCSAADRQVYEKGIAVLKDLANRVARGTFIEPPAEIQATDMASFVDSLWSSISRGYSTTIVPYVAEEQLLNGPEGGTIRTFKTIMYLDCIINPTSRFAADRDRGLALLADRDERWAEVERQRIRQAQFKVENEGRESADIRSDLQAAITAFNKTVTRLEEFKNELESRLPAEDDGPQVGVRLMYLKFIAEAYRGLSRSVELEKELKVETEVNRLLSERYGDREVSIFDRAQATQQYWAAHELELNEQFEARIEDLNEKVDQYNTDFILLYQNLNTDTVDALFIKTFDKLFGGTPAADGTRTDYGIFEWNFDPYLPQISGAAYMATIEGDHGEIRSGRELRDYIVNLFERNPSLQWASLLSSKEDESTEARARRALTYVLMIMPRENVEFNSLNAALSFIGHYAEHSVIGRWALPAVGLLESGLEVWGASEEFTVSVGPEAGQQQYLANLIQIVNNQGDVSDLPNPLSCITDGRDSEGCLGLFAENSRASYMAALMLRGYSVPDSRMRFNMAGIASMYFGEQIDLTNPLDQQTIGEREVENALQAFNNLRHRVESNDEAQDGYRNLLEQGKINTGLLNGDPEEYLIDPLRAADSLAQLKNYLRAHPELRFRLFDDLNAATVLEEWGVSQDDPWYGSLALGLLVLSRLVIDYSTLASAVMPGERLSATGELDAASGYSPADTFRIYRVQGEGNGDTFVIERATPDGQTVTAITPTAQRLHREAGGFGEFIWEGIKTSAYTIGGLAQNAGHEVDELPEAIDEAFLKGFEFGATIPASIFAQFTQIITKAKDLANLYVLSETAEDENAREYFRGMYNSLQQQFWSTLGQTYGSFFAFEMIPWVMLNEVEDLLDKEQYGLAAGLATVAVPFAIQILKKDAMFLNQLFKFLTNEDMSSARWNQYGLASSPLSGVQNLLRLIQKIYRSLGRRLLPIIENPQIRAALEKADILRNGQIHLPGVSLLLDGLETATGVIGRDGLTGGLERGVRGIFELPQPQIVGITHRRLEVNTNPVQLMNELKSILNGRILGGRVSRTLRRLIRQNPQLREKITDCLRWFAEALNSGMDINELNRELKLRVEAIFEGVQVDQSVKDAVIRRVDRFIRKKFSPGLGRRAAVRGSRLIGRLVSSVNDLLGFRWGGFRDLSRIESRTFRGMNPAGPGAMAARGIRAGEILARAGSAVRDGAREALTELGFEGETLDALTAEYSQRYMSQGLGLINPLPIGEEIEQAQMRALQEAIPQKSIELIAQDVQAELTCQLIGGQVIRGVIRVLRVPVNPQIRSGIAEIEAWLKGELPKVLNGTLKLEDLITRLKAKTAEVFQNIPGVAEMIEKLQKKVEKIIRRSLTEGGLSEAVQGRALADKSYMRRALRAARRQVMNAFRNQQQSRARDFVLSREISSRLSSIPVEMEPGMPAPSEDQLRVIREAVDSIPTEARAGMKILITREGFTLVGRDLERAFRWENAPSSQPEPQAEPRPAEPVIRWDALAEGVAIKVADNVRNPHELAFTAEHQAQVRRAIENVRRLGAQFAEGLEVEITEEGFRLVGDRYTSSDPTPWEKPVRRVPVEGGRGGAAAPLSILTPLAVLGRQNAEPVAPAPSLEAEITAQLEGITLVDSQGNALDAAGRTTKIAEIARAASERGFMAIDLSVIKAATERAAGLDAQAQTLAQVNADKLLEFISQDRSSGSRVLIAATPENFYSIGGFDGFEKVKMEVRDGTYRFVNSEDGTVLAEYELRDGYKLEQTYQVQGDNRLAERLERDIARQARQLEVKILEPFYRSLGESEARIRVRQFLANNPRVGSTAASLTLQGGMLGVGAVGAWWANGLIDALAGDDPEALMKYAPARFIATLASFEGFSRLAEMTLSEALTGRIPAWISGPSAITPAAKPNLITGVEGFGVFTVVMHGYDLVLNGLDVSEDSLLRSQWVSLPIGAVANHMLLTAFSRPDGKLGWLARGAERLFGENWAKFLSVWGTRALRAVGTVGAIATAMPVGLELGATVSSWISSDVADFETDIVDAARATYPTSQNIGSFIFGETVSACFINLVSHFTTDVSNLITGQDEDGDIRDIYQAAKDAMITAESSKVEEMAQMIWQALEEAYVGYLAANPLLLQALNSDSMEEVMAMYMRDMFEMFSHLPPQLTEMIAAVRDRLSQLKEMNDGQYVMGTYGQRIAAFFNSSGSLDTHSRVAGVALVPVWDEGPQMLNLLLAGRTEEITDIMEEQENYLAYEMFMRMSQGTEDLEVYRTLGFIDENDELNLDNEHVKAGLEMFKQEQRTAIVNRMAYLMSREFSGHTLYSEEEQNNYFICEMDQWLGLVTTDDQGILRTNQNEPNEWLSGLIGEAGQLIYRGQAGAQLNTGAEMEYLAQNFLALGFMADPQEIAEQMEQLELTPEGVDSALQAMIDDGSLLRLAHSRGEVNEGVGEDRVNLGRIRLTYMLYLESCGEDSIPVKILRAYLLAIEGGEQYDDSWMSRPGTERTALSYLERFKTALAEIRNGENVEDNALEFSSLFWKAAALASRSDF